MVLELLESVDVDLGQLLRLAVLGHVLDPVVLQRLLGRQPPLRLTDQLVDEVLCVVRDLVPLFAVEVELPFLDHLQDFLVVVAVEGRVTAEQDVEDAAC